MRTVWTHSCCLMAVAAALTAAAPWPDKPPAQWTEEDARNVLAKSPWSLEVSAVVTRRLTEEQLREGGQMGQPTGVGNEGVDPAGSGPKVSLNVFAGAGGDDRSLRSLPRGLALKLRWESALPIRVAELKLHMPEVPVTDTEGYHIAVYGIPGGPFKGDPEVLGKPLRGLATLKRDGKRDVKPVSAEVFQLDEGVVVIYAFPSSAEISKKDGQVRFEAQIGRIAVAKTFLLSEMEFMGKLEL